MNRPKMLVCFICGREFGTKSLAIHIKSCQKKWEAEESLKPVKQRRPCPRPPKEYEMMAEKPVLSAEDIQKYNGQSYNTFVEDALVQCEYCGRRFNPKSLIPHQKACKINPMIRKPYAKAESELAGSKPLAGKPNEESAASTHFNPEPHLDLKPCRKCGRNFNLDRLSKHEQVCKAEPLQAKSPLPQNKTPALDHKHLDPKQPAKNEKQPKWKAQHQDLVNAMKEMRKLKAYEAKGGKLSDLPPPPKADYSHYVECRHCGRKYAPDVAERHIPKCANIVNKPGGIQPSKIQEKYIVGTGANSQKPASKPTNGPQKIIRKIN